MRPSLEPVLMGCCNGAGSPRFKSSVPRRSDWSSSPVSLKTLPGPSDPKWMDHGPGVKRQDASPQDRHDLHQRETRYSSPSSSRLLSASERSASTVRRLENVTTASPIYLRPPPSALLVVTSSPVKPRGQSIDDETRSILLSGMSHARKRSLAGTHGRRSSAPETTTTHPRRLGYVIPRRLSSYPRSVPPASISIVATPLRRPSGSDSPRGKSQREGASEQITVSVTVHPAAPGYEPFRMTRNFDLHVLRATIPGKIRRSNPVNSRQRTPLVAIPVRVSLPSTARRGASSLKPPPLSLRRGARPGLISGTGRRLGTTVAAMPISESSLSHALLFLDVLDEPPC